MKKLVSQEMSHLQLNKAKEMPCDLSVIEIDDVPSDYDDEVLFVSPPDKQIPKKRQRIEEESNGDESLLEGDCAVTFNRPALNLPHARENCRTHKFVRDNHTTTQRSGNEHYCEKCYCFVCDALVQECKSWNTGVLPHCNAFVKNAFWENQRRDAKKNIGPSFSSILHRISRPFMGSDILNADSSIKAIVEEFNQAAEVIKVCFPSSLPSGQICRCSCHSRTRSPLMCHSCRVSWHHKQIDKWKTDRVRLNGRLQTVLMSAIVKVQNYLIDDKTACALIVLEGITRVFVTAPLPWQVDEETSTLYERILLSLRQCWLDINVHPDLGQPQYHVIKDVINKMICGEANTSCCDLARQYLMIVMTIRSWNNNRLKQSLCDQQGGSMTGLVIYSAEDEDVAAARLAVIIKKKWCKQALNFLSNTTINQVKATYVAKCQLHVPGWNFAIRSLHAMKNVKMVNIPYYRRQWILLAASQYRDKAMFVSTLSYLELLPSVPDVCLMMNQQKRTDASTPRTCPLRDFTMDDLKTLFTECQIIQCLQSDFRGVVARMSKMRTLVYVLHAVQINPTASSVDNLKWVISTCCNLNFEAEDCYLRITRTRIREWAYKLVNNAKMAPTYSHIPETTDDEELRLLLIEAFVALVCTLYDSNTDALLEFLNVFKHKKSLLACVSIFQSSKLHHIVRWDEAVIFALDNNMLSLYGSECIPRSWCKCWMSVIQDPGDYHKALNLLLNIVIEGYRKPGDEGKTLKLNAFILAALLKVNVNKTPTRLIEEGISQPSPSFVESFLRAHLGSWSSLENKILRLCDKNSGYITERRRAKTCEAEEIAKILVDEWKSTLNCTKRVETHPSCTVMLSAQRAQQETSSTYVQTKILIEPSRLMRIRDKTAHTQCQASTTSSDYVQRSSMAATQPVTSSAHIQRSSMAATQPVTSSAHAQRSSMAATQLVTSSAHAHRSSMAVTRPVTSSAHALRSSTAATQLVTSSTHAHRSSMAATRPVTSSAHAQRSSTAATQPVTSSAHAQRSSMAATQLVTSSAHAQRSSTAATQPVTSSAHAHPAVSRTSKERQTTSTSSIDANNSSEDDVYLVKMFDALEEPATRHGEEVLSSLVQQGKFEDVKRKLYSSQNCSRTSKIYCSQVDTLISTVSLDKQDLLLKACSYWLSSLLYDAVFMEWTYRKISVEVLSCLKSVHRASPRMFTTVLHLTIVKATGALSSTTLVKNRRVEVIHWLKDIKKLCLDVDKNDVWSKIFYRLTTGILQRKKPFMNDLMSCTELTRGNVDLVEESLASDDELGFV